MILIQQQITTDTLTKTNFLVKKMEETYITLMNKMRNAYWNMDRDNFLSTAGKIMDEAEKSKNITEHECYELLEVYENLTSIYDDVF